MRKTAQKAKEDANENQDVSPPKKAKLRENKSTKEGTQVVASNRLPRAAKNRTAAQAFNNAEGNVETTAKPRARAKATLRRSNSSGDIASMASGKLKKAKSKSAENLDQEDVPPAKKSKNVAVKAAKKTVPKKAGNEAKAKQGKVPKETKLNDVDEGPEQPQLPFIAKKSYSRTAAKKAVPAETKEENKPKKRAPGKNTAVPVKTTRGRGKPAVVDDAEEDAAVEDTKPAKGKRGKANEKNIATDNEDQKHEEDSENIAEDIEDAEESVKPKKGKKGPAAAKKPRGKKAVTASESVEKDSEDGLAEVPLEEPEEKKSTKGGRKGKATTAAKNRGKKTAMLDEDDNLQDKQGDDAIDNAEGGSSTSDNVQTLPKESEFKNGKGDSVEIHDDKDNQSPR